MKADEAEQTRKALAELNAAQPRYGETWVIKEELAKYGADLGRAEPIIFYAAARDWAEKNPDTIKKFRAAIAEGAVIVNNDREKTSASISKFTKQPIELVMATPPNKSEPALKAEQLGWWIEIMSSQKMLQTKLDLNKLILN